MRFRICMLIFGLATMLSGSLLAQSPRILPDLPAAVPDDRPLCLPNPTVPGDTASRILRIGLVADPQYCDAAPFNDRQFRLSPEKLSAAIDTFNRWQVDFLITLGDVIDRGPESFRRLRSIFDQLEAPQYHLLGNHEFHQIPAELKPTIRDSLDMGAPYCDFAVKGWRFILLDGTELAGYAREAHPELAGEADSLWQSVQGKARGKPWNGGIGGIQRAWLRSRLDLAAYHNEQVIIFCHFPIMPAGHHSNLWNDLEMRQLIRPYPNVVAWIAGHYHDGNYRYFQDVHHLTLRGMVMTADSNAFAVMDVYSDRLEVYGFGRERYWRMRVRVSESESESENVGVGVGVSASSSSNESVENMPLPAPLPLSLPAPLPSSSSESLSSNSFPECRVRRFWDVMGRVVLVDEVLAGDFSVPVGLEAGVYYAEEVGGRGKVVGVVPDWRE